MRHNVHHTPITRPARRTSVSSALVALTTAAVLGGTLPGSAAHGAASSSAQVAAQGGQPIAVAASARTAAASGARAVAGGSSFPVAGTNIRVRPGRLVVYRAPRTTAPRIKRGLAAVVVNGRITAVKRARQRVQVPSRGYVLAGSGSAASWLRSHAHRGVSMGVSNGSRSTTKPAQPATMRSVRIGSATFAVSGTNTDRDVDSLVVYRTPLTVTLTNVWGVEVSVLNGKIQAVNDREVSQDPNGTDIPANGYVLSGHGKAAEWLRSHATVGSSVVGGPASTPAAPAPKPAPAPPSNPAPSGSRAPMALPSKVQALYHMMWSNSGSPLLRNTPAQVNVVHLAFMQGSTPSLVGWGSQTEASFLADAKGLRARGVRIYISIGGAGGDVNLADREGFVAAIMRLNDKMPLDGLDWDIESNGPMSAADVVWISKRLKQLRGNDFGITLAPNGSNIDEYRAIAVQLHKNNALDMIGQQFYDAVVSKEAAKGRINQLVSSGIPQNKIGIGMMVGSANTYWTVDECIEAVRFIKSTYPNLRGGYLWEAGRAGTTDWANRLSPHLKG